MNLKRLDATVDIGRVAGVRLRLQLSAALLPALAIGSAFLWDGSRLRGLVFMVLFIALLYVCALIHELGHILPATKFGAKVTQIRLSWVGIFVRVESGAKTKPTHDLVIALGGPLLSAACTVLLAVATWRVAGDAPIARVMASIAQRDALALLGLLTITNGLLTLFNLLPLFPMDGGMAVRAALAHYMPPSQATHAVSTFGQVMALVMGLALFAVTGSWLFRAAGVAVLGMLFSASLGAARQTRRSPGHSA